MGNDRERERETPQPFSQRALHPKGKADKWGNSYDPQVKCATVGRLKRERLLIWGWERDVSPSYFDLKGKNSWTKYTHTWLDILGPICCLLYERAVLAGDLACDHGTKEPVSWPYSCHGLILWSGRRQEPKTSCWEKALWNSHLAESPGSW